MKDWESDDYDTQLEDTPGYLGMSWDGEFFPGPELKPLAGFDWSTYCELAQYADAARSLTVELRSGPVTVEFGSSDNVAYLLDVLPSLCVYRDLGPSDGFAAGSGYIFLLGEGATLKDLEADLGALIAALEEDLAELQQAETGGGS
jgi:hypothetical protein